MKTPDTRESGQESREGAAPRPLPSSIEGQKGELEALRQEKAEFEAIIQHNEQVLAENKRLLMETKEVHDSIIHAGAQGPPSFNITRGEAALTFCYGSLAQFKELYAFLESKGLLRYFKQEVD